MKNKSKPDYIAEIDLPCDKLVDTLSKTLKKEYGIETGKVVDSINFFLSEDPIHSFRKAVIQTIPTQIEWSVEKLSTTRCRLAAFFPFPPWLRKRFYLVFLLLSCLFSIPGLLIFIYRSLGLKGATPSLWLITLICVGAF